MSFHGRGISYKDREGGSLLLMSRKREKWTGKSVRGDRDQEVQATTVIVHLIYGWGAGPQVAPMHSFPSGNATYPFPAEQTHFRPCLETENCYRVQLGSSHPSPLSMWATPKG